jgi:hypothetical protein
MTNRLSFTYLGPDDWRLDGGAVGGSQRFASLPAAINFARETTNAAETLIELRIDEFYACVHQDAGWPHRICAPAKAASHVDPRRPISRRQNPPGQSIWAMAR